MRQVIDSNLALSHRAGCRLRHICFGKLLMRPSLLKSAALTVALTNVYCTWILGEA